MSDEKAQHRFHNPLDKLHLPWKHQRHSDDGSGTASAPEKHLHFPWKHARDDGSGTASEKQPLVSSAAPDASPPTTTTKKEPDSTIGAADPSAVTRVWDVKMPPAKMKMVNGVPVPTMGGTFGSVLTHRRRRISIEIHSEDALDEPDKAPSASLLRGDSFTHGPENDVLGEGETVVVRILKPVSSKSHGGGSDGSSAGSDHRLHAQDDDSDDVWVTNEVFGLDNIKIIKTRGSHCEMRFGHGSDTQIRHVNFSNEKDATSFRQVLDNLLQMESKRKEQRLKDFHQQHPSLAGSDEQIRLLIEIVSATNLQNADDMATNPYVIVTLGGSKEVHRTSPIHGTVDPIWTIDTGSLFILDVTPEEFFSSAQGLSFFVKNYDAVSTNDTLGKVFVLQKDLLNGDGARIEYDLEEGVADNIIRPVRHEYGRLRKDGEGLVSEANKEIHRNWKGDGEKKFQPVSDAHKLIRGDSEGEGGGDHEIRPVSDAHKWVRGVSDGDGGGDQEIRRPVRDALKWIHGDPVSKLRPGKLILRVRKATDDDVTFMERLASAQKEGVSGVYADETFVKPHVSHAEFPHREHRKADAGKQYRVKPGPDPDRPEQATKWMTEAELDLESLKLSSKWIEAGSGDLGKLFVEIISCDGLPNMDSEVLGEGKTDAFVCMVYEDTVVNTEVIKDTLSPRWMPWTQRAFIFNVMHPSSDLMLGVLDYDATAKHDPIGRAEIDVPNMRPGTEYVLNYDLYTSAIVKKERKANGSIKLRVRLELPNERKAIMTGLQPPPQIYVNVATSRDYHATNFVIEGKYDIHVFNMDLFAEYAAELKGAALALLPIMKDAAFTVVFWRGHFPLGLRVFRCPPLPAGDGISFWNRYTKSVTILLPLHSAVAFIGGTLLVEDYNLFPSFLLFSVAWFFLATSGNIRHNPSPWRHPRSFLEIMGVFISNSSPVQTIEPNQNDDEVQKFLAKEEEAEKKLEEEAKEKTEEETKEKDAVGNVEAGEDGAEVNMRTKSRSFGVSGVSVNPLKFILYPMQQNLELGCRWVCIARSFVNWEESYYCYWIVVSSIIGGLAILFVPWGWLVNWALRIGVWVVLGPWMKLVDIFFMQRDQTTEQARKAHEARMKRRVKRLLASTTYTQMQKEEKIKLKAMKKYMFGQYLSVLPKFKQQRYLDFPLAPSCAYAHTVGEIYDITSRKYGQQLTGDMIPRREIDQPASTKD